MKKSLCTLLLAFALLMAAMPTLTAAEDGGEEYPMFHYDLQRTGNLSGDAPMTDDILWSTYLGGFVGSSPIVAHGCVYVSNWEMGVGSYGLHCLDERTGTIMWNNSLNGGDGGASTAALFGDWLVVGSKNGYLYCINATSGETLWSKKIEHDPQFWGVASSPVVYEAEDLIFVTTFSNNSLNNGTLHVFDFNGTEVWSLSTGDTFYFTSPAIADGKVFFAGNLTTHALFCVNISSHTILWRFNTSTQIKSTPAIWNATVFFAAEDSMYAVNARTGSEVWTSPFSCMMSSPAVSNGKVYIGSEDEKKLYCYDGITGVELWNCTVDGIIQSSPVVAHETVFFGTTVYGAGDGTVYALNTTDGSLRWSYNVGLCVMSSPAVADGILFVGADDGSVYAFGKNPAITTTIRIEGKNETIWYGDVTFSNSTIVDTANVSHYFDKPTALGALDAASKLGDFSYEVENQTEGLLVKSIRGEAKNPEAEDRWQYRVDYYSPTVGAADFVVGVTEPPSTPHREILWYYGSGATDPLDVTLDKTSVAVGEFFNVTVRYYNDTASGWEPLNNATVYVGAVNYTTDSDGNATLSLSSSGTYTVYAEKEGFVRSLKRNVSIFIPCVTVRIEGKNETIWYGEVTVGNSTIVDTANVSHYFDKPTALGALDTASKLGNFSYEVEDMGWGLLVTSIGGEAYNPITWDPSWLYRVDYYSPMVGAADFIVGVTEPPPAPHEEVLWYLGSFTAAPLTITLDKTIVTAGEPFNATVTYYNDTTSGWEPLDNATVHVGTVNYMTGSDGNAALSLSRAGSYTVYAEKEGFVRSLKRNVNVSLPCITVRIEGKNETVWYGEVIVGTSTIVDTANVSHYFDNPTALGALDAASKLGNFSYEVEDIGWGLMVTSIGGEGYNPVTWDPSWLYRVDYYLPIVGAADFVINVTEPPAPPHEEVLWYLGSFTAAPLTITLDKTIVTAGEPFNATVTYYDDTTSGWKPLDNATVHVGAVNYTTCSDGNATLSLSSSGSYTVYAEKEGFVRSIKKNVSVSLPCITVRIEGKNETIWYGEVTVSNSTIVDTANVSHYFDNPTALGALDAASKLGNFSYEVEDIGWGLMVTSIGGEGYNPVTWDPSWLYRVDYYLPIVGAADFIINVTELPAPPHEEVLWYLGSFTAAPLKITLDKTSVTVNEHFTTTVESYNDISGLWDLVDNATVHVGGSNYTTDLNGSAVIALSNAGTYAIYAEKGGYVRSEKMSITVTPEGGGGDDGDGISWWLDVSVSLPEGSFTKTSFNTNKIFTIEYQTALGALQKASEIKGFEYKVEEWDFGPFVYSIGDKQKYDEGGTSGWMYQVNDEDPPNVGAHDYSVDVGDEIIWYFSKNMDTTPSTASRALRITIEQPSEGSGGKESISSPTPAPAPTQVIEGLKKIALIEAGSNASVTFDKTNVTRIFITANNTIRNAEVMIQPLGEAVFAINVSGVPYCYFNVTTTNLTDIDIANATIEFKVNRTWINVSNVDKATITLFRYHDNHWNSLQTSKIDEDTASVYFKAETPGFSVFVISGERKTLPALVSSPSPTVSLPAPEATTEKTSATAMAPMPASASMPQIMIPRQKEIVVAIVSIAVLLIVLVAYYARRRESK